MHVCERSKDMEREKGRNTDRKNREKNITFPLPISLLLDT